MKDGINKYTLSEYATIKEAIRAITNNLTRCVIVVDSGGRVIGVLSEGDILRALVEDVALFASVRTILSPTFCFSRSINLEQALDLLRQKGVTLIPIVDEQFQLVDVVTIQNILEKAELRD